MRIMSESIRAFSADAQGLSSMTIDGIIEDYRKDALKMLGEKGLAEWKARGNLYEIDDVYGMDWQHYAALVNQDELRQHLYDKGYN